MNAVRIRCGVIGHPLTHTRSPELHQAFAAQTGVDLDYVVLSVGPDDFENAVADFFGAGGRGLNVTLPYKASALALADEAGEMAVRAGAANVLTRLDDGRLRADNVDGAGFLRDLERLGFDPRGARICILGAGGAAAGVACALLDADAAEVTILNRHAERAVKLAARLDDPRVHVQVAQTSGFDLLVNATSASLVNQCPEFPEGMVGRHTLGYDLVYAAEPTPFMRRVADLGARTNDGWGMLVEQAAESFRLWHGLQPDMGPLLYDRR